MDVNIGSAAIAAFRTETDFGRKNSAKLQTKAGK
jgi:hypothetical protein